MTTAMGPPPPPPRTAASATAVAATTTTTTEVTVTAESLDNESPQISSTAAAKSPMGPPPSCGNPNPPESDASEKPQSDAADSIVAKRSSSSAVPYTVPEWSGPPCHKFYLEVLKDGCIIDQFPVSEKGAYMFGRVDLCDFVLEHPTISRFHAVLQFKRSGDAYLYDLGSTHGTVINKNEVEKRVYIDLHVGDVIRFGHSSRLYILQGPPDLMPPETDLKILRHAKIRQEMLDQEASLRRARVEASVADGISWGMGEDAIEEAEDDDDDEITWQTYKGQLTEKQEKTRDKLIKRTEKIAHMKKEIDAIRAKDIAQGGLTQGQQTQIARNEQRITQIMEELESLEETLNESIRESIGARAGRISHVKRKGMADDDEEFLSDDDDFYDRTKKPSKPKAGENQSVETADTLLDKRDAIMKEIEEKQELLSIEKNKITSETVAETEVGDALDAYMSGLSSQLVHDKTMNLQNELSTLQAELDRIFFLLKIADPSGEAAKKWGLKAQEPKPDKAEVLVAANERALSAEPKKSSGLEKPINISMQKERTEDAKVEKIESNKKPDGDKIAMDTVEGKTAVYTVVKPQWLGAVHDRDVKETQDQELSNMDDSDQFVDYKDRQKILDSVDDMNADSGIEGAAPGLIIRRRKKTEEPSAIRNEASEQSTSSSAGTDLIVEDAVALLLKHKRGYHAEDEEGGYENQETLGRSQPVKDKKKPKRVLGPEKPFFLGSNSEYETWLPPEGQSGDGKTSLNDRYGY